MRILFLLVFALSCSDDASPLADSSTSEASDVEVQDVNAPDIDPRNVSDSDVGEPDVGEPDVGPPAVCPTIDPAVVTFRTADDVELEAALFAAPTAGRPAVVLFHMIPPSNDRGNYRRAFIDRLVTQCINVLNVDRRGAGGSSGVALEAYEGVGGALDAQAAFDFLSAHELAPSGFMMIGASNGTTSLNDYVSSESPASLSGAVLLSGGTYTENQTTMVDSGLRALPTLFMYPDSEAAWNAALEESAPATWRFMAHTAASHGTRMLDDEDAASAVVDFVAEMLFNPERED